jgi:hypothetical protein
VSLKNATRSRVCRGASERSASWNRIANLNCPLKAPLAVHLHGSTLIHIRGNTDRLVFRLCRHHIEQRGWIQETKDRSWCGRCNPDTDNKEATDDTTVPSYEFRSAREFSLRYGLQHLQTGVLLIGNQPQRRRDRRLPLQVSLRLGRHPYRHQFPQ